MKVVAAVLACLVLLFGVVAFSQQGPPITVAPPPNFGEDPGTYQILQGEYVVRADEQNVEVPALFRINTRTGQTWVHIRSKSEDGKFRSWWVPIADARD
jgi:hypothetical protein